MTFATPESFMQDIESLINTHGFNHIDAVLYYCEDHDIEMEEILPLVTRTMKEKIKMDAQQLGMMKSEARLPI